MMKFQSLCSVLIIGMFLVSCASQRKAGWDQRSELVKLSAAAKKSTQKQADNAWAKRHIKDELFQSIKYYETLASATESKVDYYKLCVRLTRAYYFLADAHLDNMDEKKKYWNIGSAWGEKAMATNEEFANAVKSGAEVKDALKYLNGEQKEAIYWTAVNLGKWAKASGIATLLKYKSQIRDMVKIVEAADETYFYGAPHRYWGVYYAVAPGFAGGDINKSTKHFDRTTKLAPSYLGTYVLRAKFHDTKRGNEKAFKANLNKVLKAKVNLKGAIGPENLMEQKKAKKLMANMDDLF